VPRLRRSTTWARSARLRPRWRKGASALSRAKPAATSSGAGSSVGKPGPMLIFYDRRRTFTMVQNLQAIVAAVREHPGIRNKAPIALVADVLGRSDWQGGPGDDGAVVAAGDTTLVVGGEALWPPFVAADPFGAGIAAVLANVNDLAAMGAEPLAVVDTVVASEEVARRALEGMRHASALYRVPVVGGHLTLADGPPSISAFGLGRAGKTVLSARRAEPGQALVAAVCTQGTMRDDFP